MALGNQIQNSADVVNELRLSHRLLSEQSDLSPRNPVVNDLLTGLVRFATSASTPKLEPELLAELKSEGLVHSFRDLCHRAECLLEAHYADMLCAR